MDEITEYCSIFNRKPDEILAFDFLSDHSAVVLRLPAGDPVMFKEDPGIILELERAVPFEFCGFWTYLDDNNAPISAKSYIVSRPLED